jgi:hypothetical protein
MQPVVQIDTTQFQAALHQYIMLSRRGLAEIVNKQAGKALWRAYRRTPAASRESIRSLRDDEHRWPRVARGYLRLKGWPAPPTMLEFTARLKSLAKARLRAVGTLRAGWLGALEAFGRGLHLRRKAQHLGSGERAIATLNPTAVATYKVLVRGSIDPRVAQAMQAGLDYAASDMLVYVEDKLRKAWR